MNTCPVCQQDKLSSSVIAKEDPNGIEAPKVTEIRHRCSCCGYLAIVTPETFAVISSDRKRTLYDTLHANLHCAAEAAQAVPDLALRVTLETHLQHVRTEVDFLREELKKAKFEGCGWKALHDQLSDQLDQLIAEQSARPINKQA